MDEETQNTAEGSLGERGPTLLFTPQPFMPFWMINKIYSWERSPFSGLCRSSPPKSHPAVLLLAHPCLRGGAWGCPSKETSVLLCWDSPTTLGLIPAGFASPQAEPGGVHPTSGPDAPPATGKATWLASAACLLPPWGITVCNGLFCFVFCVYTHFNICIRRSTGTDTAMDFPALALPPTCRLTPPSTLLSPQQ